MRPGDVHLSHVRPPPPHTDRSHFKPLTLTDFSVCPSTHNVCVSIKLLHTHSVNPTVLSEVKGHGEKRQLGKAFSVVALRNVVPAVSPELLLLLLQVPLEETSLRNGQRHSENRKLVSPWQQLYWDILQFITIIISWYIAVVGVLQIQAPSHELISHAHVGRWVTELFLLKNYNLPSRDTRWEQKGSKGPELNWWKWWRFSLSLKASG